VLLRFRRRSGVGAIQAKGFEPPAPWRRRRIGREGEMQDAFGTHHRHERPRVDFARTRPRKACGVNAGVFKVCSSVTRPLPIFPHPLPRLIWNIKRPFIASWRSSVSPSRAGDAECRRRRADRCIPRSDIAAGEPCSILRVRKTGKGQFRPRKSRQTEEYPEIIFGALSTLHKGGRGCGHQIPAYLCGV